MPAVAVQVAHGQPAAHGGASKARAGVRRSVCEGVSTLTHEELKGLPIVGQRIDPVLLVVDVAVGNG